MLGATLPIWFIAMGYVYFRTSYLQEQNLSAVGLTAMHFLKLSLPMTAAYLFLAYAAASDSCTIARYVVIGYLDYLWAPIVASCMLGWRNAGSGWAWYRVLPIVFGAAVFVWDPTKVYNEGTAGQYASMKDGGTLLAMAARLLLMLHGALAEQVAMEARQNLREAPLSPPRVAAGGESEGEGEGEEMPMGKIGPAGGEAESRGDLLNTRVRESAESRQSGSDSHGHFNADSSHFNADSRHFNADSSHFNAD